MSSFENIILQLNEVFNLSIKDSVFKLTEKRLNVFVSESNSMSKAINTRRNDKTEINVCHWFSDFWFYFEIKLLEDNLFLTLSIFQGNQDDDKKTQLFRAEWDNYLNNIFHPQPHWHIYPYKYNSQTYDDFEAFIDIVSDSGFEASINNNQPNKLVDISNFHFALNGNWYSGENHINKCEISEVGKLTNWVSGILLHIKGQLEHIS